MQKIYFVNSGEIDMDAAMTMGVNAKPNSSSPIGFFGTGLKYAIAVLLRHGAKISIWSGEQSYHFTAQTKQTRGTEYRVVCANDKPLGFTTDLGKNWELWMAYRELRCNCQDEGGFIQTDAVPMADAGTTIVEVRSEEFAKIHANASQWFLDTKPIETVVEPASFPASQIEIHSPGKFGGAIYYKGVLVAKPESDQLFTYNFLGHMVLTEDRTVGDAWNIRYRVAKALAVTKNSEAMTQVLSHPDSLENKRLYWSSSFDMSDEVKAILAFHRSEIKSDLSHLQAIAKGPKELTAREPTHDEFIHIGEALTMLELIGFDAIDQTIHISDDLGENILGQAKDKTIWLSPQIMVQGPQRIASTILEEYLHIVHGFTDNSREFQSYLIDLVVENSLNCLNK